jgi:dipeptidyl aminopeptidase/acylaminoacyl peptidase
MQDLRTGRQVRIQAGPQCDLVGSLALAGSHAYWVAFCDPFCDTDTLWGASPRDRQRHFLAPIDLPPVSDGKGVYFWSTQGSVGRILRFRGLKRRRFSGRITLPAELAAGGGRFARATFPRRRDDASWPAWSPDGKAIAFVRGPYYCAWDDPVGCAGRDQIWLMNADGTDRHLIAAHGVTPAWSPDGTKLAYGAPNDQVVIANADGSDQQVVTSGLYPAWSPDGHDLAVQDHGSIWVVSTDGTNRHRVLRNAAAPAWSPDGSQLVFTRGEALMVANADGSNVRSLPVSPYVLRASWSPDGSEIAYGFDSNAGQPNVCEIRPDGTGKHCLHLGGSVALNGNDFWSGDPAWGPAPGQLVFSQDDEQAGPGFGAFNLVTWPGDRQITAPSPEVIRVYSNTGRKIAQTEAGGTLLALAVSRRVLAGLLRDPRGGWSVKIYQPRPRTLRLPGRPDTLLSASGTTLVFQIGRTIETLNALRGSPHPVARPSKPASSISIFGRRIAWQDDEHIFTLNLGR